LRLDGNRQQLENLLARGVAELGDDPASVPIGALADLAERVARWTRRVDLTGHRGAEEVARRLVLDALALCAAVPPFETLADLGSGAGFPGLPIAIRHSDRLVTLVEARERRVHFQRMAVRELGLSNARIVHGRAELVPATPHAAVVAQAMGPPADAVELMRRWAAPGAWLLLPASGRPPHPALLPDLDQVQVVRYRLPLGDIQRTVLVGKLPAI
jgi:16S rRNA (guanine527-N7)-methyltransferase